MNIVSTLFISLFLLFSVPVNALAVDETVQDDKEIVVQVDNKEVAESVESLNKTIGEVSGKLDKLNDVNTQLTEIDSGISTVDGKLDTLLIQGAEPEIKAVERVSGVNLNFTAYCNVSPTNQYSEYARNVIPKMGWNDDYVFLQDSSSSYVLVYGDIDYYSSGVFEGTDCTYTRWYYSGTGTGYIQQSGMANIRISVNDYVVLSTLGDYPLLDNGFTLFRQECCYYVTAAVILFCLRSCFAYVTRNAK